MGNRKRLKMKLPRGVHNVASATTELVTKKDKEWFEQHPGEYYYVRPYVPGEAPRQFTDTSPYVLVRQIRPGLRERRPIPQKLADLLLTDLFDLPTPGNNVYPLKTLKPGMSKEEIQAEGARVTAILSTLDLTGIEWKVW